MLDIHVDAGASPPLEIFEAGTGHGSLTLALARAVHAGNAHLPRPLTEETKAQRGAIIHTLDKSSRHSQQARDTVRGFRRGMYKDNVEFYVGDPSEWIRAQLEKRGIAPKEGNPGPGFLYAVVLDLPGPEEHLKAASDALINDGIVCVFCPSITQIATCVSAARQLTLPLALDKVFEFPGGAGTGAGLRSWDVRFAHVRSRTARPLSVAEAENPAETEVEDAGNKYEMVCRPTSFENFVGGGFFAMFRRKARGGEGSGTAKNLAAVAARAAAAAAATEEKIAAKMAAKAAAEAEAARKAVEETGDETVAEERIEEGAVEQAGIDTHNTHQK
jgi:tRNA (adenine57-N1/adenine58-N1)-methyltransferase